MSKKLEKLNIHQARKLVLHSQQILSTKKASSALESSLEAIENLSYVQIDTISVVERAHHHTMWARNPRYKKSQLEELLASKKVFEYWAHAASYLPMCDFRFSLPRKAAIKKGVQSHWYEKDKKLMKSILKRIREEGPLMAKDFEFKGKKLAEWTSKPAKRALENLFMQGELMIPYRKKFHKVYDLTERVLPASIDDSMPSPQENARFLIKSFLRANGLAKLREIVYLRRNVKSEVEKCLKEMVADSDLLEIDVAGSSYFVLPNSLNLLDKRLAKNKLKILSPFDNLLIQRKRMKELFDFDYLIECYVPKEKRKYGYFSLPILWQGNFVARMDCKNDRKESVLHIKHLALEPELEDLEAFSLALSKELKNFLDCNNCKELLLHKTTPNKVKSFVQKAIDKL